MTKRGEAGLLRRLYCTCPRWSYFAKLGKGHTYASRVKYGGMNWTEITVPVARIAQPDSKRFRDLGVICTALETAFSGKVSRFSIHHLPVTQARSESHPRRQWLLKILIPQALWLDHEEVATIVSSVLSGNVKSLRILDAITVDQPSRNDSTQFDRFRSQRGTCDELRLQFLTPVSKKLLGYINEGEIDSARFLACVAKRFHQMLGEQVVLPDHSDSLCVFGQYASKYQGADTEYSITGPLFIRNPSPELVAALWQLQQLHLEGRKATSWRAYFRVRWQHSPVLDSAIERVGPLVNAAQETVGKNDVRAVMGPSGDLLSPTDIAKQLLDRIKSDEFVFQATQAFEISKANGGKRVVEQLETLDLVLQRRLRDLLAPLVDKTLDDNALGFRRGRGREEAVARIRQAISTGFRFVVESDIEECFPTIPHDRLLADLNRLLLQCDAKVRSFVTSVIKQPRWHAGMLQQRDVGLAQGSPLSPLLANFCLRSLDRAFSERSTRLIRYADDLVILCRTHNDAAWALQQLTQSLETINLRAASGKTRISSVADGFVFLGERFDLRDVEDPIDAILAQRKPLVITLPFVALGANGEALEARTDGRIVATWPLRRLSEVILLNRATISTAAIERCGRHGIPLAIAINGGKSMATLRPQNRAYHELAYAHGRWYSDLSDVERLAFAQTIVRAKLHNYAELVAQRRKYPDLAKQLERSEQDAAIASSLDQLRGIEGAAARKCFAWLRNQLIPTAQSAFSAGRRERGGSRPTQFVTKFFLLSPLCPNEWVGSCAWIESLSWAATRWRRRLRNPRLRFD